MIERSNPDAKSRFRQRIRRDVQQELNAASSKEQRGEPKMAFSHLERAHILGQSITAEHVRVHWAMFLWGWRQRSLRECFGQTFRIIGALTKTAIGWVPAGNSGGANVSPFKQMPIPHDLKQQMESARMELVDE